MTPMERAVRALAGHEDRPGGGQMPSTDPVEVPRTAGESTCPICGRTWTVTLWADCLMPACGCYGTDTGPDNPDRPCEPCGISHAMNCEKRPRTRDAD